MLMLAPGEVHLWLAKYDQFAHSGSLEDALSMLTDEERTQMARFHFNRDRLRYLITRALVRTTLSRYAPIPATRWRFTYNVYGQPRIADLHGPNACALRFNVSHTHCLIALAVTHEADVGVDVENVTTRTAPIDIADQFLSRDETTALLALEPGRQHHRFFEYWTLKESYMKACGMGLSMPLTKFTFSYPSDTTVVIDIDADLDDAPNRWTFWQLEPSPGYLLALCLRQLTDALPRLILQPATSQISCTLSAAPVELSTSLRRRSPSLRT